MLLALVTLGLLGDVAPGPFVRPQCTADTECVVSTFDGCCGSCCGRSPHAVPRGVNEAGPCATSACSPPNCAAVRCEPIAAASEFVAACRGGRCVAVPKSAPIAECRVSSDCSVMNVAPPPGDSCHRSACGCCPVSLAMPIDSVVPLQKRPPNTKNSPGEKPDFGLSTGKPTQPQAPNCSPCPAPSGGTAVCRAGRCMLQTQQPIPRPFPRPPG